MHKRLETRRPIHRRDPLFAALFDRAERIVMKVEPTPHGVKVIESSTDPATVVMIQAHARVVSKFVERGHAEVRLNHEVPKLPADKPKESKAPAPEASKTPNPEGTGSAPPVKPPSDS
mgnify:CR=1 FL=1